MSIDANLCYIGFSPTLSIHIGGAASMLGSATKIALEESSIEGAVSTKVHHTIQIRMLILKIRWKAASRLHDGLQLDIWASKLNWSNKSRTHNCYQTTM
jgi:hypothetical protein